MTSPARLTLVLVLVCTLVLLAGPGGAPAFAGGGVVYDVDSTDDAPDADLDDPLCLTEDQECTLRAAVMQANHHDGAETINLPAGTYKLTIPADINGEPDAEGDLFVDTALTINGAGSGRGISGAGAGESTVIDGNDANRIIDNSVGGDLTINGVAFQNGHPGDAQFFGGAIRSGFGAGTGARLVLNDTLFHDNKAGNGGAVVANGVLEVTDSTFHHNSGTSGEGGAIYYVSGTENGAHLSIASSQVFENSNHSYGGIYTNGTATIDAAIYDNHAVGAGGGIGIFGSATLTAGIYGNEVTGTGPLEGLGGGIYSANSTIDMVDSDITLNTASRQGGGIMALEQSDDAMNINLLDMTIANNEAPDGGGIYMGNSTASGGGGLTLTNSTLERNEATTGNGGAIYSNGAARLSRVVAVNTTISGNSAGETGGAIFATGSNAETELRFVTVAENTANEAGGLAQAAGAGVAIENSIVFGNLADGANNCQGSIEVTGANLVGDATGCNLTGPDAADVITGDPLLEPLSDDGLGTTDTHALRAGSPAIDKAEDCPPPGTDQRGAPRPSGVACDLGAYERVTGLIWGDNTCSGGLDTFDALVALYVAAAIFVTAVSGDDCPDPNFPIVSLHWVDTDCSGEIEAADAIPVLAYLAGSPAEPIGDCPPVGEVIVFQS